MLYISCHGTEVNKVQYLIFENEYGGGDFVSLEELKGLMQRAKKKINLIFLAACDSEEIGKVFRDAGIEHVICVAN